MKVHRLDHVGINVNDLSAAKEFFLDLGLELQGEGSLEGDWLDGIVGLKGVKTSFAFFGVPEAEGQGKASIELIKYHSPADEYGIRQSLANTHGIRHIAFAVDDIEAIVAKLKEKGTQTFGEIYDYEGMYKLVYVHGPEGIILELAQQIG